MILIKITYNKVGTIRPYASYVDLDQFFTQNKTFFRAAWKASAD